MALACTIGMRDVIDGRPLRKTYLFTKPLKLKFAFDVELIEDLFMSDLSSALTSLKYFSILLFKNFVSCYIVLQQKVVKLDLKDS